MTAPFLGAEATAIVEWLADVGARWGLPAEACRVHGLLYLRARPVAANTIAAELSMAPGTVERALAWLVAEELALPGTDGWTTEADPWLLMVQTLEKRRQRELSPALAVLGPWRSAGLSGDPLVARQARRLLELVDDLAAIDAGTKRFSPQTLRHMIGIGGRAARFFDRRQRKGE